MRKHGRAIIFRDTANQENLSMVDLRIRTGPCASTSDRRAFFPNRLKGQPETLMRSLRLTTSSELEVAIA
jgi:hypothetical protein